MQVLVAFIVAGNMFYFTFVSYDRVKYSIMHNLGMNKSSITSEANQTLNQIYIKIV